MWTAPHAHLVSLIGTRACLPAADNSITGSCVSPPQGLRGLGVRRGTHPMARAFSLTQIGRVERVSPQLHLLLTPQQLITPCSLLKQCGGCLFTVCQCMKGGAYQQRRGALTLSSSPKLANPSSPICDAGELALGLRKAGGQR